MRLVSRLRELTFDQVVRTVMLKTPITSAMLQGYYRAKFAEPVWRGVVNRRAVAKHRAAPLELVGAQRDVSDELRANGIAIFDLDDVLGRGAFERVRAEAQTLFARDDIAAEIAAGKGKVGGKEFVVRVFRRDPVLDMATAIGSLCTNERILAIVNDYLGMYASLKSFDLWHNVPVASEAPEIASQRWHRDYDDHRLVKLFVYLVDVDDTMGPFTYLKKTQPGGRYGHVFPPTPPLGTYPPQDEVERRIPTEQRVRCTGRAGTAILCDTTGFHKGGRSTSLPRELVTVTFASQGALDHDRYRVVGAPSAMSPAVKFATSG